MSKEVMKQALEALSMPCDFWNKTQFIKVTEAIKALEKALKQEQDEPVAWEYEEYRHAIHGQMEWFPEVAFVQPPDAPFLFRKIKPLYTTPQQRKPLTDEQILHIVSTHIGEISPSYPLDNSDWINFAHAIESAHGIKENK